MSDIEKVVALFKEIGILFRVIDKGFVFDGPLGPMTWRQCLDIEACVGSIQLSASFQFDDQGNFVRVGLDNYTAPSVVPMGELTIGEAPHG